VCQGLNPIQLRRLVVRTLTTSLGGGPAPAQLEAYAWGATLDRARRFGGWRGAIESAVRGIPEAVPGASIVTSLWRFSRNLRRAGFVGALAPTHSPFIVPPLGVRSRRLAGGGPQVPE